MEKMVKDEEGHQLHVVCLEGGARLRRFGRV